MARIDRFLESIDDKEAEEALNILLERKPLEEVAAEIDARIEIIHISEIRDKIKEAFKNWGKISGLSTGYKALDHRIGGLKKGEVTLIGGATNTGKSALAANIARNVAKTGSGVLYITLEMVKEEIGSRIMFINGGEVDDLNLMFQSEHRLDYRDVKRLFTKASKIGDVKLVVLDYLQYLGRGMTNEEVAKMSKEMKSLALEFEVPFIVIVSLRKGGSEGYRRKWVDIEIEDFMGSGAIGYDADVAMITSRNDPDDEFQEDKIYVKILKVRNWRLNNSERIAELNWEKTRITEGY